MAETIPGFHVWEVAGKAVSVHISLEMIDRLSGVIMTGFAAIPRRGAEVGGILIGTISGTNVRIEEFEAVPCSYKLGPSYLLADADAAAFAEAWDKWKPASGKSAYAVGFYRSNTRDQTAITDVDRELCAKYFPPPYNVLLFVKPSAMKVSMAGFITYESGRLEDQSAQEFPFRRYELEGTGAPPPRRALTDRAPRTNPERTPQRRPAEIDTQPQTEMPPPRRPRQGPAYIGSDAEQHSETPPPPRPRQGPAYVGPAADYASAPPGYSPSVGTGYAKEYEAEPERPYAVMTEEQARPRRWLWVPLSFIFLLLGVLLGFQAALTMNPKNSPADDPYRIGLAATGAGENVHVKWDRQSPSIKAAKRGSLTIRDGDYSKRVDLDVSQLQTGSVIYKKLTNKVQFRVELYPEDHVTISETVDWSE